MELNSQTQHRLRKSKYSFDVYRLYIERHMKECDLIWSRFRIHLSLNAGAVAILGVLLKNSFNKMLLDVPEWVWGTTCVVLMVAAYLAHRWRQVCEDGKRWQMLIDRQIASIEQDLFSKGGLYTTILREYEKRKCGKLDVVDISIRVAGFFFSLWLGCFLFTFFLLVATFAL